MLLIIGGLLVACMCMARRQGYRPGPKTAKQRTVYRDKEPALFAENQRGLKQWCFWLVPMARPAR
jgi:hypothetical protein